ncbi:hypothetical protein Syun_022767 [Stephania yunnanensis]|uniref:Uncharacterized protein n=1 Tax=Stephania yunnanensis TaxID=152371 RepID=A0AAP0I2Z7_9MAGN
MISGGFSLEVFKQWAPSEKNLIALPGGNPRVVDDTRNSVKEEPRGTNGCGGVWAEQRRRRSRAQLAAAEDRGGDQAASGSGTGSEQRRRKYAEATRVGGTGGRGMGGSRGRGALLMARDNGSKEGPAAAVQKKGQRWQRTAAPEEKTVQRQWRRSRIPRSGTGTG